MTKQYSIQDSIPVGCVPSTCTNRTCFNSHPMSALGGGGLEVNMFEQVCSDGHRMSLAGKVQSSPMSAGGGGSGLELGGPVQ